MFGRPHIRAARLPARPLAGILVGVDCSEQSTLAVRQALALREHGGTIEVLAAMPPPATVSPTYGQGLIVHERERAARKALADARELAPSAHAELTPGFAAASLIEEAKRTCATTIAVGAGRRHRLSGLMTGSVATRVLHEAPCSVLVARPAADAEAFPRSILVGTDGSPAAEDALGTALALSERLGVPVQQLAVTGPPRAAVQALIEASKDHDLLVVGSRALRGVRAVASVSERVAHGAHCSVLVVRPRAVPSELARAA